MTGRSSIRVLLVDDDLERKKAIKDALKKHWQAQVDTPQSKEQALSKIKQRHSDPKEHRDIVLVAYGFDGLGYIEVLRAACNLLGARVAMIAGSAGLEPPSAGGPIYPLVIGPGDRVAGQALVPSLAPVLGPEQRTPPAMSLDPGPQPDAGKRELLRLQVCALDPEGDFRRGEKVLCELLQQLVNQDFTVHPMGQGFSGAKVFLVSYEGVGTGSGRQLRVVKLTSEANAWKCDHEVKSHWEAAQVLNQAEFRTVPEIFGNRDASSETVVPAYTAGWYAVMYNLLGSQKFDLADFEQAYLAPSLYVPNLSGDVSRLLDSRNITLPQFFLEHVFERLKLLYHADCRVEKRQVWCRKELSKGQPPVFPPYRSTQWEKAAILQSVESLAEYGRSLLSCDWQTACECVRSVVESNYAVGEVMRLLEERKHPVLLCPVHGDLNANNILIVLLEMGLVFLIDFAVYQSAGDAMQDFARLEVAIKLQLMGREQEGPRAKDLSSEEFERWCAAERWLAETFVGASSDPLPTSGTSTERAYRLCQELRKLAAQNHDQLVQKVARESPEQLKYGTPDFRLSYQVALLYHTLRAIRYTLPHLKRILAVYSVAEIVRTLP